MENPFTSLLLAMIRGLRSMIPDEVTQTINGVVDFAYVKVLGLPFIVLGYRATGKTTLLEWMQRKNVERLAEMTPEPTAAGGEMVLPYNAQISDERMRMRPRRDVGGEYAMWETDWVELLRETKPRGIIFMMDHNHPYHHKDALNFVMQLIEEEAVATQNLQHIMVMVNKSDLWADDMTLDELLDDYRNEVRRLKSQAERVGYTYTIMPTSLMTGENIEAALSTFFNAIRPRAERAAS